MKKFIGHFLKYNLFFIVSFIVIFFILLQKQNEVYSIEKKNIIIGDSNTRWGIDDNILSNYKNYSTGGETYLFALTKIKMLSKDNKIDTLILSFNPHNLINNKWWDDTEDTPLQNRMPFFFNDFTWEDHKILIKNMPRNYLISLNKTGKFRITELLTFHETSKMFKFGSFSPTKGKNTNDTIFSHKIPAKICDLEIYYLKKIKKVCDEKNIKLILIQPPKNNQSVRYPFYNFKVFYDIYQKDFINVDFLDFSKMNIPENYFWDIYHLNDQGANYFSSFLEKNKIRNLLDSDYNNKSKQ